ncbi:hypothetical protein B0T09DRAFT_261879, partial [Sordaria sp. MPI-SDFR-AT-0083]
YKFHFCSKGANCTSGYGWVNRRGETYIRPYEREATLRHECSSLRYRGCSGQKYVDGDTNESDRMCPQCEANANSRRSRRHHIEY